MKKFLSIAALAVLAILGMGAAATYVETGLIPYPSGFDAPPNYRSRTWYPTNISGSYSFLAAGFTNGVAITLTNVILPIERDQAIGLTLTAAAQGATTPVGSNITVFGKLSYDGGRTWTTTQLLLGTGAFTGTNTAFRPIFYIPNTNMAAAQLIQITTVSNANGAGTANHTTLFLSNVTLATRIPNPR